MTKFAILPRFARDLSDMNLSDAQRFKKAWENFAYSEDLSGSGLRLKQLKGTQDRWSIRVSEAERIIFWHPEANFWVAECCGSRDRVYEHANAVRTTANLLKGKLTNVFVGEKLPSKAIAEDVPVGNLFDHWSDKELNEYALFTELQISELRSCINETDIYYFHSEFGYTGDKSNWDDLLVQKALDLLNQTLDEFFQLAVNENPLLLFAQEGGFADMSPALSKEELLEIGWTYEPIEDWMVFLHPSQSEAARCKSIGPVFVGGAAGTGKSVVGYHRSIELVKRYRNSKLSKPVLLTTFNKPFSSAQNNLIALLSKKASSSIEVKNLDALAHSICRKANRNWAVHATESNNAFRRSLKDSPLKNLYTDNYLKDEVQLVIKGRNIKELEEYLVLERRGRRTRFSRGVREEVWKLYRRYQQELGEHRDFQDQILEATQIALAGPGLYRACVVDEVQDFTYAKLRLVRALVTGSTDVIPADGLTLLGDRAQQLYPGGSSLREAGIETRGQGRSYTLTKNYRNSAEILKAALAIKNSDIKSLSQADLQLISEAPVTNQLPKIIPCVTEESQDRALVELIKSFSSSDIKYGDIAILLPSNKKLTHYYQLLKNTEIPYQVLKDYNGKTNAQVKIGTYKLSRSLEFKVVLLPDISDGTFPARQFSHTADDEYVEQLESDRRGLHVAMTRAQRNLALLYVGSPSSFLSDHLDNFLLPNGFNKNSKL